jgi:hypothetical protein
VDIGSKHLCVKIVRKTSKRSPFQIGATLLKKIIPENICSEFGNININLSYHCEAKFT